jgi:hypothetical protein
VTSEVRPRSWRSYLGEAWREVRPAIVPTIVTVAFLCALALVLKELA